MSGQHLLVLRHGPLVGPGTLAPSLDGRARQLPWHEVDLDAGAALPDLAGVAGLLVLGGVMDHDDADPWLAPERDLLVDAVEARVPVLGVCLGAQQLGRALGGEATSLPQVHADLPPLHRTAAGRDHDVLAGWPDGAPGLFHHRDVVSRLPDGAVPLLEGAAPTVAAWRDASDTALAVQFHPEASPDGVEAWSRLRDEVPYDREAFLARVAATAATVRAAGVALVARWVDVRVLPRAG